MQAFSLTSYVKPGNLNQNTSTSKSTEVTEKGGA
jgi:hypothetical protein